MRLIWVVFFFFSSRRRHTRWNCDWSSDVCSSDLQKNSSLRAKERSQEPRELTCVVYWEIAWHFRFAGTTGTTKRNSRFQSSWLSICGGGKGTDGAHPPASGQLPGAGTQTML